MFKRLVCLKDMRKVGELTMPPKITIWLNLYVVWVCQRCGQIIIRESK